MKPKQTKKPKAAKHDDPSQSRIFMSKAREIGADEERSAADEVMRRLHQKPHEPHGKKPDG
jgi:hypothetical protein